MLTQVRNRSNLLKGGSMKILPVHLLKLRWLLANTDLLKRTELELVQNMQQVWSKVNYQVSCPVVLASLEKVYETTYETSKRSPHVND
jgi:hypothetical protein